MPGPEFNSEEGRNDFRASVQRFQSSSPRDQMTALWRSPAEVIAANKSVLEARGEPIVERLSMGPLHVRLQSPSIELTPDQVDILGLSGLKGAPQLTVVRDAEFSMVVYGDKTTGEEHVAVMKGVGDGENVPIRIHSSCLTAETFHASNCDCSEQLNKAMSIAEDEGVGGVIWLHQEGRGNGLAAKAEQLRLMFEEGMDTVQAYESMGLPSEQRDFTAAAHILKDLGINSVRLITNNPDKVAQTEALGVKVTERIPCEIPAQNEVVRKDLLAKHTSHGHMFEQDLG